MPNPHFPSPEGGAITLERGHKSGVIRCTFNLTYFISPFHPLFSFLFPSTSDWNFEKAFPSEFICRKLRYGCSRFVRAIARYDDISRKKAILPGRDFHVSRSVLKKIKFPIFGSLKGLVGTMVVGRQ